MTHTPLLASRARKHEPRTGHRDSSLDSGETPARLSPNNSRPGPPARAPGEQLTFPAEPLTPRAPIQSNASERLPRLTGVRSSAGVPPDGQRHDDCRHGALNNHDSGHSTILHVSKIEGTLSGPTGGRRGRDPSEIKGDGKWCFRCEFSAYTKQRTSVWALRHD